VDLTSRDLQTGSIQLPGRLQDLPPAGRLEARDPETDAHYDLNLEAPRELKGLAAYFTASALRTNDAVRLTFRDGLLLLEAVRRQRRRDVSTPARPRPAAAAPLPAEAASAPEQQDGSGIREHSAPPEAGPQQAPVESAAGETHAADPFASFAAAGDYESFAADDSLDLGSDDPAMEPGPVEPAADREEEPLTGPAAGAADDSSGPPDGSTAGYYTLGTRRPFRAHSLRDPAELSPAASPPLPPAAEQDTAARPGPVVQTGQPVSAEARLEAYLGRPDLPAIIRVSQLATELDVDPDELAAAVARHAAGPDSPLSSVRPDYYLYRRPRD
jgi:hypothetical protein